MRPWVLHGHNPLALRAAKTKMIRNGCWFLWRTTIAFRGVGSARRLRRKVRTLRDTLRWAWRASNRVR